MKSDIYAFLRLLDPGLARVPARHLVAVARTGAAGDGHDEASRPIQPRAARIG